MGDQIFQIISRINSPELQSGLTWIKIPFLVITAFFIAVIIISITQTPYLRLSMFGDAVELSTFRPFGFPRFKRRWQRTMRRLETGNETEYKLAVIEADTMLNEVLQKMRLAGANVEERLEKVTPFMLSNLEELKTAHQARTSIVYDPDYRLSLERAKDVLLVYEKAFENLDLFR